MWHGASPHVAKGKERATGGGKTKHPLSPPLLPGSEGARGIWGLFWCLLSAAVSSCHVSPYQLVGCCDVGLYRSDFWSHWLIFLTLLKRGQHYMARLSRNDIVGKLCKGVDRSLHCPERSILEYYEWHQQNYWYPFCGQHFWQKSATAMWANMVNICNVTV